MSPINDGGPIHPWQYMDFQPHTGEQVVREQGFGMSLRDYFAGHALCGLIAGALTNADRLGNVCAYAGKAYELADAMIQQQTKNTETK